jgi:hypothetical protein
MLGVKTLNAIKPSVDKVGDQVVNAVQARVRQDGGSACLVNQV